MSRSFSHYAAVYLSYWGPTNDAEITSNLLEGFRHSDPVIRQTVVVSSRFNNCESITLALFGALQDRNVDVQREARSSLHDPMRLRTMDWAPIVAKLKDDNLLIRAEALALIGSFGGGGNSVVPPLIEMLHDENPRSRALAATALGQMGPLAKEAVPALVRGLQDNDPEFRQEDEAALRKIDPAAAKRAEAKGKQ